MLLSEGIQFHSFARAGTDTAADEQQIKAIKEKLEEQMDNQEQQDNDQEQNENDQEQNENDQEQDREAIERILRMLENQEENSLKNNQEVIRGKVDKYDW